VTTPDMSWPAFTRILVPVDFSSHSDAALSCALSLARRLGAQLELFHVVEDPHTAGAWGAEVAYVPSVQEILGNYAKTCEGLLAELKRRAGGDDAAVTTRVLIGSPARTIVERAQEGAFDLVVMGTHGRTGLAHVVMGSVAERVVRHAPCPVLTIREARGPAAGAAPAATGEVVPF
jgi:universal stress protein A